MNKQRLAAIMDGVVFMGSNLILGVAIVAAWCCFCTCIVLLVAGNLHDGPAAREWWYGTTIGLSSAAIVRAWIALRAWADSE